MAHEAVSIVNDGGVRMGCDALRVDLGARGWAEDDPLREEAAQVGRAKGDRDAFAPLYARYAERVHWYCFRILGDREAAEDAAAQTFAKALATIGRCRDDRFRAWLFTIARNVALDEPRF